MSDKTKPEQQSATLEEAVDVLSPDNPVIKRDEYIFGDYQDNAMFKDPLDITRHFKIGFDPKPYDFKWFRYNNLESARSRYFVQVDKTIHARWFKPEAFHPIRSGICSGEEYMNGEMPENYLFVRPIEAAQAETQQMIALGERNRNPKENDKYQSNMQGMSDALASEGGSIKDNSRKVISTWPKHNT